ncbi:UPF0182 family protein [Promethearchaeum syntrophicum]|uniref:UPF0182 family protein n=1 Tax=Promethearchaeum syntrophicum TaxID=2594042 RepID=A0A5B9DB01_9ARCH|nr:UPF0182 family protein [Candidatus Prometheoarchaeum syntrophicum]
MAKKSCSKHYRYVATCPNCRAENDAKEPDKIVEPEIPLYGDVNEGEDRAPPPDRFQYIRRLPPGSRKRLLIIGVVIAIVIVIIGLWSIPLWLAKINLQQQLYAVKGGNLDFWELYTLNFWSTNFFFNKIGLIGALIGCFIMSIPPENTLLALLGRKFGWGVISKKKVFLLWWTAGFALFFIIGQAMETGYFALSMYMIEEGDTSFSFLKAISILNGNSNVSQLDVFIYKSVTLPIINYILILIALRVIILIVKYFLLKDEFLIAAQVSFLIEIFFLMGLFGKPLDTLNGIDFIQIWSIYLGLIIFLGVGIAFMIIGKRRRRINITQFPRNIQKQAIVSALAIIIIILIPVFSSIPKSVGLTQQEIWEEVEWDVKYEKQIDWTRQAAGMEIGTKEFFTVNDINDYPDNVTVEDLDLLNVIRRYDKQISVKQMDPIAQLTHESLADSDIIFIPNGTGQGEYWVAPKTINVDILDNSVKMHTEFYDHVEGFIALDTSSGGIVDNAEFEAIFGVSSDHPIFFGEREESFDTSSVFDTTTFIEKIAYENDILLGSNWSTTNTYRYDITNDLPDGNLTGLQAFWFTLDMGLTSYALDGQLKEYLINRNIRTRVESVLMPGLRIDDDPYLVFDRENGKMFYAVSIFTDIEIGSYTMCPMYRFMGVALIDVKSGEISWYRNPGLPAFTNDNLGSLWSLYANLYPWQDPEIWLMNQLRYPETLWENQLKVDYIYHVTEPTTWFAENDFYVLPDNGDVFYIETDLGDGLEFVGVQLVKYTRAEALKLAGLYIIRQGEHFGETLFYQTLNSLQDLTGPNTASDQFETDASERITLIGDNRFGNVLLYPLAGSLYYFIPVYSVLEDYETLAFIGLVNAFNKSLIAYGNTLAEAYSDLSIKLDLTTPVETSSDDLALNLISYTEEITYGVDNWAEFRTLIDYFNTTETLPMRNLTLNMTVRSAVNMSVKVSNVLIPGIEYDFTPLTTAFNYTLATWNDTTGLNPGDLAGITIKMNTEENLDSDIYVYYKFDLIDIDDPTKILSTVWYSILWNVDV